MVRGRRETGRNPYTSPSLCPKGAFPKSGEEASLGAERELTLRAHGAERVCSRQPRRAS